jgi:glutathione S-transferase
MPSADPVIRLHYYPGNASMVPHILLHELNARFTLQLVDRTQGAHKSPEYLKLNPNGLIPVLEDGALVLYETAAICLHLVDTHPQAGLAPALGTAERAHFYKWLVWMTNSMQATLMPFFYPERCVDDGNAEGAAQVRTHAQARIGDLLS